jgi:hypothetical protein
LLIDEGKRYKIETVDGNNYLYVSEQGMDFTSADENARKTEEFRSLMECICALATDLLGRGASLEEVEEHLINANGWRNTILSTVVEKIRDYGKVI